MHCENDTEGRASVYSTEIQAENRQRNHCARPRRSRFTKGEKIKYKDKNYKVRGVKPKCLDNTDEADNKDVRNLHRNIMQIVWLVIPGVGPGYRGAGPWPGVGVPQQRRASVAAVAVARP